MKTPKGSTFFYFFSLVFLTFMVVVFAMWGFLPEPPESVLHIENAIISFCAFVLSLITAYVFHKVEKEENKL